MKCIGLIYDCYNTVNIRRGRNIRHVKDARHPPREGWVTSCWKDAWNTAAATVSRSPSSEQDSCWSNSCGVCHPLQKVQTSKNFFVFYNLIEKIEIEKYLKLNNAEKLIIPNIPTVLTALFDRLHEKSLDSFISTDNFLSGRPSGRRKNLVQAKRVIGSSRAGCRGNTIVPSVI